MSENTRFTDLIKTAFWEELFRVLMTLKKEQVDSFFQKVNPNRFWIYGEEPVSIEEALKQVLNL